MLKKNCKTLHSIQPLRDTHNYAYENTNYYHHCLNKFNKLKSYYEFEKHQIKILQEATTTLFNLYLKAIDHIIKEKRYEEIGVPQVAHAYIEKTWENKDPFFLGRFDLCYNGINPPKLYEFNVNPGEALEASILQTQWQIISNTKGTQFNNLIQAIYYKWKEILQKRNNPIIHFSTFEQQEDVKMYIRFFEQICIHAGYRTQYIDITNLKWNGKDFIDTQKKIISILYKIYPWEWMFLEEFNEIFIKSNTLFLDPGWSILMNTKGILAILWELFPNHPNLLPAFLKNNPKEKQLQKPFWGRQGIGISMAPNLQESNIYTGFNSNNYVYQAYYPLPCFSGCYPILSSWIVGDQAAGISIRDGKSLITDGKDFIIPHIIV